MQIDSRAKAIREEEAIIKKFGVSPVLIPDYLALVGYSADGYPGISGIGVYKGLLTERSARYLLNTGIQNLQVVCILLLYNVSGRPTTIRYTTLKRIIHSLHS